MSFAYLSSKMDDHDGVETATAEAHSDIESIIAGFYVKDRLGQELFGDNTYLTYADDPLNIKMGKICEAKFEFSMPRLPKRDYTVSMSIATGNQAVAMQQHWIHNAQSFKSASSHATVGPVGIPMKQIKLTGTLDA